MSEEDILFKSPLKTFMAKITLKKACEEYQRHDRQPDRRENVLFHGWLNFHIFEKKKSQWKLF